DGEVLARAGEAAIQDQGVAEALEFFVQIFYRLRPRTLSPAAGLRHPKGAPESPSAMEKVPMTSGGYQALDEELNRLKTVERPAVTAATGEARAHGDPSENAEYHAAKDRQGWIEGQIAEIEDRMARAQVIDVSKLSGNQVKFGATVSVIDEDTEQEA